MSHARNRLRALGLGLIAVLGLMALMAGGAQGQWFLLGTNSLNGIELIGHETIDAEYHESPLAGSVAKVPTLAGGLEIICHKVDLTEGLLLGISLTTPPNEPNIAHVTIHYTECLTFTEGIARPACNPVNGLILKKALILPILHPAGTVKLLFEPTPGEEAFTTINMPGSCALPIKNKVTGSYVVECLKESDLTLLTCRHEQVNQLLRPVPHALGLALGDTLKYGNHAASMSGVVRVFMAGGHKGEVFGVEALNH